MKNVYFQFYAIFPVLLLIENTHMHTYPSHSNFQIQMSAELPK